MSDYHDYNENLAFPPQGDWSDTQPKSNTDRTDSTIELVEKIEKLSKQLEIAVTSLKDIAYNENVVIFRRTAQYALKQIKELEK